MRVLGIPPLDMYRTAIQLAFGWHAMTKRTRLAACSLVLANESLRSF